MSGSRHATEWVDPVTQAGLRSPPAPKTPQIEEHVILAPFTTFKIGGPAALFTVAGSADELLQAVRWAQSERLAWFILGSGANVLIGDRGFNGLVIKNDATRIAFHDGVLVTAESGVTMKHLIAATMMRQLSGLEHFVGIPSTLGGALWQNLHFLAPRRDRTVYIEEAVESALVVTDSGVEVLTHADFAFGYDYSILHDTEYVVLSVTLRLAPGCSRTMRAVAAANLEWRRRSHPPRAEERSAGSVFRKIDGVGAGRLIDTAGLKGTRVGGAEVSGRHANYILNTGAATAQDVRALIEVVQTVVKRQTGHVLVPEISFVGEF